MGNYIVKDVWRYFSQNVRSCIPLNDKKLSYWDLTVVYSGELIYTVDGTKYTVGKNDVILIPKGSVRIREAGQKARYVIFNFTALDDAALQRDVY